MEGLCPVVQVVNRENSSSLRRRNLDISDVGVICCRCTAGVPSIMPCFRCETGISSISPCFLYATGISSEMPCFPIPVIGPRSGDLACVGKTAGVLAQC